MTKKLILVLLSFLFINNVNAGVNYHYFKTKAWKNMCVVAGTTDAQLCLKYWIIYKWDQVIKWDGPSSYVWIEMPVEVSYDNQTFCVSMWKEIDVKICEELKKQEVKDEAKEEISSESDTSSGETILENSWSLTVTQEQFTTSSWETLTWEVIELKNNIEEVEDVTTEPITQTWSEEDTETWALEEQTSSWTIQKIDTENISKTCSIWPIKVDCWVLKWDFSSIKNLNEIIFLVVIIVFVLIVLTLSKKKKTKVIKSVETPKKVDLDPLSEANDFF